MDQIDQNQMPPAPAAASNAGDGGKAPLYALVAIIVIVASGYLWFSMNNSNEDTDIDDNQNLPIEQTNTIVPDGFVPPTDQPPVPESIVEPEQVKTFTLVAKNFSFLPLEIKVKQGDKVKIVLDNQDGFHDLVIDEYSVRTKQINAGQTDEISFTADKVGTFEYYCSVGKHRAMGMKGNLIVE